MNRVKAAAVLFYADWTGIWSCRVCLWRGGVLLKRKNISFMTVQYTIFINIYNIIVALVRTCDAIIIILLLLLLLLVIIIMIFYTSVRRRASYHSVSGAAARAAPRWYLLGSQDVSCCLPGHAYVCATPSSGLTIAFCLNISYIILISHRLSLRSIFAF